MSHFTVTVKLSAERLQRHSGDIDAALAEILAPYEEGTEDERYREFVDTEDEYRKEFEQESSERVRTPQGELLYSFDDRFRVPGTYGTGGGTHRVPDDCQVVEVPIKELFADFETYATEYHCSKRDEKTGRFGYWTNPKKTWDWYKIGGRWTGFYPLKPGIEPRIGSPGVMTDPAEPGHGDLVKLAEIDFDAVRAKSIKRAKEFHAKYTTWLAAPMTAWDPPWDSPRQKAMTIGLVRVEQERVTAGPGEVAFPWDQHVRADDSRRDWTDVARTISLEQLLAEYLPSFNPIVTYAALDDEGWHAPGKMGWWGCSSDTPDSKVRFQREFEARFLKNTKDDDTLVVVDCHI